MEVMAKQVLDIRAGKGMTTSQSNEFLRNANGGERLKRWSGNYDSTREHLNFEIKKGGVICEVDKKTSVPKRIKILERGDRFSETGARHRSTEEYHAELREKLMSENEQLSQTIEGQQTVIREQRATLSGLEKDIKHATARFKALQTMIANLESKKNRLLEEVEQLKRDRDSGKISAEEAKIRLDRIQKELEEVDEKIADKTQKLHTAELQLAQLQTKTLSAERKFEEVQKKLQKEVPLLSKATDAKHRVAKYHEFLSSLPFEQRQVARQTGDILFDGSIAETIMDNAVQVTSIAAALYLGYLDAATKISQSGSGGGGPGTGWGKRDDESLLSSSLSSLLYIHIIIGLHVMR
jgi:outer membrane murein-binding lipoprotein Lpp